MPSPETPWWMPLELLERNRFRVLQKLYDLAGGDTDRPLDVDAGAIAGALGVSEADVSQAVAFLIHAHYASEADPGGQLCVTRRAVYYLEAGAYQRRTIRD
jgi:hypothetical protein